MAKCTHINDFRLEKRSPMKWRCNKNGCYLDERTIPYNKLVHALPNRMGMSDVDGMIERKGHFMFIEWKNSFSDLSVGQTIALKNLSNKPDVHVVVIWGNYVKETIEQVAIFHDGEQYDYPSWGWDELWKHQHEWFARADKS